MSDSRFQECLGSDNPGRRCRRHHPTGLASAIGGYKCCCGKPWGTDTCLSGAPRGTLVPLQDRLLAVLTYIASGTNREVDKAALDAIVAEVYVDLNQSLKIQQVWQNGWSEMFSRALSAEARIARLRARHQPKSVVKLTPCKAHMPPDGPSLAPINVMGCTDCTKEVTTICSNITCCDWPCKDMIALEDTNDE